MTTGAGPFTSLVSAHDAPPLLQTKRNATAIFDKDAACIEFLPSGIHDLMLSSREIFFSVTASCRHRPAPTTPPTLEIMLQGSLAPPRGRTVTPKLPVSAIFKARP